MSKKAVVSILSLIVMMAGCAKMPIYQSDWNSEHNITGNTKVGQYDNSAGLEYNVSNDSNRLYVSLETANPLTQMKIFRNGVKIYVNTEGKRDRSTYLVFPDTQIQLNKSFMDVRGNNFRKHIRKLKELSSSMYKEAQWHKNQKTSIVTPSKKKNSFSLKLSADSVGNLEYKVGIPLSQINPEGANSISNLTVGIHIAGLKKSDSGKSKDQEQSEGADGDSDEYGSSQSGQESPLTNAIKIWFKVKLASK